MAALQPKKFSEKEHDVSLYKRCNFTVADIGGHDVRIHIYIYILHEQLH